MVNTAKIMERKCNVWMGSLIAQHFTFNFLSEIVLLLLVFTVYLSSVIVLINVHPTTH